MTDGDQRKGRPLGPTGEAVRANIRQIRDAQGISGPELSERMGRFGRPIPPLGIHRIESGQRRVDVDDLVVLAIALNVSPASLLMPDLSTADKGDLVPVSGFPKPITASAVWRWLMALAPIVRGTGGTFLNAALPSWERDRRLAEIEAAAESGITYVEVFDGEEREIHGIEGLHGNDQ